jgi:hypothetical protein
MTASDEHVDFIFQVIGVDWAAVAGTVAILTIAVALWLWRRRSTR